MSYNLGDKVWYVKDKSAMLEKCPVCKHEKCIPSSGKIVVQGTVTQITHVKTTVVDNYFYQIDNGYWGKFFDTEEKANAYLLG